VLVDDGRFAFLSSLKPVALEKSLPFGDELGMSWTPRMDQSVMGTTLLSMGRAFSRGIGVHAPSRLSWKLDQPYARLRGSVAIDDDVLSLGARGSVVFRISGNGKRLFESAVVRGGDAAVPFQVDLSGVDELTLEVDVADKSFVADRADWLQMLLVKPQ
jgi:alpha-galactosidase